MSFRIWVRGRQLAVLQKSPSYCEFQDLGSRKTIGSAREIKGLYYFDDGAIREEQVQVAKKVPSVSD